MKQFAWQRKLQERGGRIFDRMDAFAQSGKLERVGQRFDQAGNKMIRGGVTMAFWPVIAIIKAFRRKEAK